MTEETANPVQTVPIEPVPASSGSAEKGSPLLVVLTVLLVLVGIADVILWGVVGYYLLENKTDGGGEPAQVISGELARSAAGTVSGDGAEQDALVMYI